MDDLFELCGFRNEKCDYTLLIVCAALVVCVILLLAAAYFVHDYLYVSSLHAFIEIS